MVRRKLTFRGPTHPREVDKGVGWRPEDHPFPDKEYTEGVRRGDEDPVPDRASPFPSLRVSLSGLHG